MDQNAMMESDTLIAVDECDNIIPNASISKKRAHVFGPSSPRGILHRAFSVFLFNSQKDLLLTRRSLDKITFPGVWTNTCCSHPLQNMIPNEVDDPNVDYPHFPGTKYAAIRKLHHELGIEPEAVPHEKFRFLTRFHYWATDIQNDDANDDDVPLPIWGEHEIDYIFFIQCMDDIKVRPNPEEVAEYKFVSMNELKSMMYPSSSNNNHEEPLKWSPWFQGIMERGGFDWWENLQDALEENPSSNIYCNKDVTFFDPPLNFVASYNLPSHGRRTGVLSLDDST